MHARRSVCLLLGLALVIFVQTPPAAQNAAGGSRGYSATAVREVRAAERARGDPQSEPPSPDGGGEPLVSRRAGQRGAGTHGVRASVRAHDVSGLEARAARRPFSAARKSRRHGSQRHDRLRPDQLFRDGAGEPVGAGALARIRSDGIPAREGRPGSAVESAGCRAQRAAPERREPAVRTGRRSHRADALPEGTSVLRQRHRIARGHPVREAR